MKKNDFFVWLATFVLLSCLACSSNEKAENYGEPYSPEKPLVVSQIGPQKGGLGTRVVVSGSNFGNDPSKVKLFFNSKEALILKLQSNAIYAMVPKQPGEYSTIKVAVEEGQNSDGTAKYREAVLENMQFKYNIKATVTTVAGQLGVNSAKDGMALEASFGRPVMLAVDPTGTLLISDDGARMVRMLSIQDNKLSTVLSGMHEPWQCSYNLDFTRYYVLERRSSQRPLLFYGLFKDSNWQESEAFYDQKDDNGNYIAGNMDYYGLAADDKYVFIMSASGKRLIRVDQETRKVELIGENLNMDSWAHIAYNKKNGYLYITSEAWGRLYRLDPYHTPPGHSTPWLTQADIEHIVGTGKGAAKEGNGKSAQLGEIEGMAADQEGNVYLADYSNHVIWKVDEEFNATIYAGVPGESGYRDGKPQEALFNKPYDVAATPDGILYVADVYNYLIRCIAVQ
ncbi:IPT/TIG domain-containing protein [Parabacteroides pacaensis]|uniref:IPT/TIG domain-containing protein n=1 Tax=Parabacteroides pacaensis TaxID=2086575 RepID=UPI000D0F6B02|nr:IPT/TIG domain-containing protein [Parabacteroides pacaensis]